MKRTLNRFILSVPRLYLKQYPYAWIFFIALWKWPPGLSFIFLLIIIMGMALVTWQHSAWLASMHDEHGSHGETFYVDRPPIPMARAIRNIAILIVAAGAVSFFLNKQIDATQLQVFLVIVGFSLLYRNSLFFGAPTTYIITPHGLAIYFAPSNPDYRLFIHFDEINRMERCGYQRDRNWDCFARTKADDGLLLVPQNPNGFTRLVEKLFIVPTDIDDFMAHLSPRLKS